MMKNKIFFLTIFIFLSQCGYQTIYSNKNSNFNIVEIKIINDQNIGRQIKNRLSVLSNANKNSDNYYLEIDSKFEKTTASKDKQGNPNTFNIIVSVRLTLSNNKNIKETKVFSESISYDNSENKFSLKRYENSLKENLTDRIVDNLLIYLQGISSNRSNASITGDIGYTVKKQ